MCERLQKEESPHVDVANLFVSWFLETPIDTLFDALDYFIKQKGLREEYVSSWVCDFLIRQTDVKTDLESRSATASAPRAHGAADGALARAQAAKARLLHQGGLPHAGE